MDEYDLKEDVQEIRMVRSVQSLMEPYFVHRSVKELSHVYVTGRNRSHLRVMHMEIFTRIWRMYIDKPGKVELVYTSEDGEEKRSLVQEFKAPGVAMGMHNMTASIESLR